MKTPALFIITGASRGMGAALVDLLLTPGVRLLCLSRTVSDTLTAQAVSTGAGLEQWSVDLADPVAAEARLASWLQSLDPSQFASVTLINNAGLLGEIGPVESVSVPGLSAALRVGMEAPLLLTAAFLRQTAGWQAERRVLNISSGLGRRAMAGTAAYCAAKAGLDHATRALALEQADRPNGARLVSLAPGVIDTGMQLELRSADADAFPERSRFAQLAEDRQLASPVDAAQRVLAYLLRPDFGSQPVADVRDAAGS